MATPRICKACGFENLRQHRRCVRCGADLRTGEGGRPIDPVRKQGAASYRTFSAAAPGAHRKEVIDEPPPDEVWGALPPLFRTGLVLTGVGGLGALAFLVVNRVLEMGTIGTLIAARGVLWVAITGASMAGAAAAARMADTIKVQRVAWAGVVLPAPLIAAFFLGTEVQAMWAAHREQVGPVARPGTVLRSPDSIRSTEPVETPPPEDEGLAEAPREITFPHPDLSDYEEGEISSRWVVGDGRDGAPRAVELQVRWFQHQVSENPMVQYQHDGRVLGYLDHQSYYLDLDCDGMLETLRSKDEELELPACFAPTAGVDPSEIPEQEDG